MTEPQTPSAERELAHLLEVLEPMLARVAALDPAAVTDEAGARALEAALEAAFPYAGERVQGLGRLLERGVREGWLADRGNEEARFSRVSKPGPRTHDMSIDVVSMRGSGLEHTHPQGEITVGFPAQMNGAGNCQFESRPPAWVFLPPGSRHVPHVEGERMNLIYFLPQGAVEWHRD
jgi:hypothetical protein